MTIVCGVDVGSLRTLSYLAWLRDHRFVLDLYIPSIENPLPRPPEGWPQPFHIAFDAPLGLAAVGRKRRKADADAKTPTSTLPADRDELRQRRLYRGLIEAGLEISWAVYEQGIASIAGFEHATGCRTTVLETYPRYVITRLWPELKIPSKRKAPLAYVNAIWDRIQDADYSCTSVLRPAVDHLDAMLCAIAAAACVTDNGLPKGTVGSKPIIDADAKVLREGYIVSP